jgi:hypothetical protein
MSTLTWRALSELGYPMLRAEAQCALLGNCMSRLAVSGATDGNVVVFTNAL